MLSAELTPLIVVIRNRTEVVFGPYCSGIAGFTGFEDTGERKGGYSLPLGGSRYLVSESLDIEKRKGFPGPLARGPGLGSRCWLERTEQDRAGGPVSSECTLAKGLVTSEEALA